MNSKIMRALGFGKQVDLVEAGRCPFCEKMIAAIAELNRVVNATHFRDFLSYKEYTISGMCQECQDQTFNNDEE